METRKCMPSLIDLAWEHSRADIEKMFYILLGVLGFILMFILALTIELSKMARGGWFASLPVTETFTRTDAMLIGLYNGLSNAALWSIVLVVALIIFEYLLSFATMLYLYDGESWSFVNAFRKWYNDLRVSELARSEQAKYRANLRMDKFRGEIAKMKNAEKEPSPKPKAKAKPRNRNKIKESKEIIEL